MNTKTQDHKISITYNDTITRRFVFASVVWGIVGMLVGVLIASQLAWPELNFAPWFSFGRLRPLHTNAVIFAFVGNMIFAGVYYSTQRLVKARLPSDLLANIHFWGWQLIIVAAAITLPLGLTQAKEYAELEWPIDLAVVIVWITFAINFFWNLKKRNEKNLYVALWFYIATILTVALLYIVNNLSLPFSFFKSYTIYAGVKDALVQWWYGHNAVAFFLTTPILGIMYYFLPKAANRPVYSYKLSIIHFWSLVFMYIWAGPHHLLNSSLPDWAQNLGVVFSIALWAPSWGGMINGLLTLRGAWDKLRTDPVIKFFVAAITFYGMSTFEGPLLSIKSVNGLAHNTDWIIAHVHGGGLGWNAFMAAGMFYWIVPRLYNTKLFSTKLANYHFWIGLFGIMLYMAAMYTSGLTQGLMWRALTDQGTLLYPNFLESIFASQNMYILRVVGGLLFLGSFILMAFNLLLTARSGVPVDGVVQVSPRETKEDVPWTKIVFSPTTAILVIGLFLLCVLAIRNYFTSIFAIFGFFVLIIGAFSLSNYMYGTVNKKPWHQVLEGRPLIFSSFVLIAVLIGGLVELVPALTVRDAVPYTQMPKPYTPLELAGRDIYVREGCYNCHTQMIRSMVSDSLRYGAPSESWEYAYDFPFQWGSKRTGPDLQRIGKKYPDLWHYKHLINPQETSAGSLMPPYAFLAKDKVNFKTLAAKLKLMQKLGVPYKASEISNASKNARQQANIITEELTRGEINADPESELIALIAYLQKLGVDLKNKDSVTMETK